MSKKQIYDTLVAAGMTREGACGLMGNMMAESSMRSNIAQRGMTKLTDTQYTAAADNGLIDFAHDSVGYGLCQWTFPTRKQNLLNFAKARSVSVGNENMQIDFCLYELRYNAEYSSVWATLTASHDLRWCSDIVCVNYEKPAVNNTDARYQFSKAFFDEFANSSEIPNISPIINQQKDVIFLQLAMQEDGDWDKPIDGLNTKEWYAAFREYAKAVLRGDSL